jgi:hypothetical protein
LIERFNAIKAGKVGLVWFSYAPTSLTLTAVLGSDGLLVEQKFRCIPERDFQTMVQVAINST